jgi:hypothetical protein
LQDAESLGDEIRWSSDPFLDCKLLDSDFDDLDGAEGKDIGHWLGCPAASMARVREE